MSQVGQVDRRAVINNQNVRLDALGSETDAGGGADARGTYSQRK